VIIVKSAKNWKNRADVNLSKRAPRRSAISAKTAIFVNIVKLMNPFSIESWFGSDNLNKRHNKRVMGKILGGREAYYSRGWGTRRGALLGGDKIGWYRG